MHFPRKLRRHVLFVMLGQQVARDEEAGETFDETLTKADASKRIDALQEKTGRGK